MADGIATEAEADTLAEAVRSELVMLRQGLGISAGAVKQVGKQICRLPAVDDERRRNPKLPRYAAAYNVIRCAVQAGVGNFRYRKILVRTLNIDGLGPGATLKERREELCSHVLHLKFGTNYLNFEELAFQELVAVLLTIERSPCHAVEPLPFRSHADRFKEMLASHLDDEAQIRIPMAQLIGTIISWIPDAADKTERDAIVDLAIGYLPNLQPIIWGPSRIPPHQGDDREPEITADNRRLLLEELFFVLWARMRSARPTLLSRPMRVLLWSDHIGDPLFEKRILEQFAPRSSLRETSSPPARTATVVYFDHRYEYFQRLGALMKQYDDDNAWGSIFGELADGNPADKADVQAHQQIVPEHEESTASSDPDPSLDDKPPSDGSTHPPGRSRRRRTR